MCIFPLRQTMGSDTEDQTVGHQISVVENDYVLVEVFGTVTRDDREKIHSQVIETITDTGVTKALIDHSRSRLRMTTLESYEFGKVLHKTMSEVGRTARPRLAIVVPDEDRCREDKVFAVMVAGNLGASIREFTDKRAGIAYLLANDR